MILTFKYFCEAWTNAIGKTSREASVTSNQKYRSPEDFKKNSTQIGKIGSLNIHSDSSGSGETIFTHDPTTGTIHHVIHSVQKTDTDRGPELKFLSAHGRENSPVRTGEVYSHLMQHHNYTFVGTGHSPGAQKMWSRFHDNPNLEVVGRHPDGSVTPLNNGDKMYADKKTTDPAERKIGQMELIARKKSN